MRVPFLPLTAVSLDLGSAVTKVMVRDKIIWQQASCVAIHRHSQSVVSLGDAAFSLVGKEPADVEVWFPLLHAEIIDRHWAHLYLRAVTTSVLPLQQHKRWSRLKWWVHVPAGLSTAARQTFARVNKKALGSVTLVSTQVAIQNLISQGLLPSEGAVVVIGAHMTNMFIFAQREIVMSNYFRWGMEELQTTISKVLFQDFKLVATRATLQQMLQQVGGVHLSGKEAQNSMVIQAKSLETQSSLGRVVTSQQFAPQIFEAISDFLVWLRGSLVEVPDEIQKTFIANGVFLAGGGAQLSGLAAVISEQLRCPVQIVPEPSLAIVKGLVDQVSEKK